MKFWVPSQQQYGFQACFVSSHHEDLGTFEHVNGAGDLFPRLLTCDHARIRTLRTTLCHGNGKQVEGSIRRPCDTSPMPL